MLFNYKAQKGHHAKSGLQFSIKEKKLYHHTFLMSKQQFFAMHGRRQIVDTKCNVSKSCLSM